MSFECPGCKENSLDITFVVELPPDSTDDEVDLQIVECSRCGFQGAAVYHESRHGSLESDSWHHDGYRLGKESLEALIKAMKQCPSPSNRRCRCSFHQSMEEAYMENRFYVHKVEGIVIEGYFDIALNTPAGAPECSPMEMSPAYTSAPLGKPTLPANEQIHPGLEYHFLMMRILTVFALVGMSIITGTTLWTVLEARQMYPPWSYVMTALITLAAVATFFFWRACRLWYSSQKNILHQASSLVSGTTSTPVLLTSIVRKRGIQWLIALAKVQPFDSKPGKGSTWLALSSLNMTVPDGEEAAQIYLYEDPNDEGGGRPLAVVQTKNGMLIGTPLTFTRLITVIRNKVKMITLGVGFLAFLTVLLVLGIYCRHAGLAQRDLVLSLAALQWPQTLGEIVSSSMRETLIYYGDQHVSDTGYLVEVKYRYRVADREFVGERLCFGYRADTDRVRAHDLLWRYPAGARVSVYYNPQKPGLAVLEVGQITELEEILTRARKVMPVLLLTLPALVGVALMVARLVMIVRLKRGILAAICPGCDDF